MTRRDEIPNGLRQALVLQDLPRPVERLSEQQAAEVHGGTILLVNGGGNTPRMVDQDETITIHGSRIG